MYLKNELRYTPCLYFQHDKSTINLHLMHTSYFLFVMVVMVLVFALFKGRSLSAAYAHAEKMQVNVKPPSGKTGSASYKMYKPQQQQHRSKQWAVDLEGFKQQMCYYYFVTRQNDYFRELLTFKVLNF